MATQKKAAQRGPRSVKRSTLSTSRQKLDAAKRGAMGKRGRKPPPSGKTKRDRFVRLCEMRTEKAIRAIELLGNLAAPHYAWTPEDLERVHVALMDAIERTFTRFEARAPRGEAPSFSLH